MKTSKCYCKALRGSLLEFIAEELKYGAIAELNHELIRERVMIRDRRTWLKYLHALEEERILKVCYGKNQYAPTAVMAGERFAMAMAEVCNYRSLRSMLWHRYPSSKYRCHGITDSYDMARVVDNVQRMSGVDGAYAMAPNERAMAQRNNAGKGECYGIKDSILRKTNTLHYDNAMASTAGEYLTTDTAGDTDFLSGFDKTQNFSDLQTLSLSILYNYKVQVFNTHSVSISSCSTCKDNVIIREGAVIPDKHTHLTDLGKKTDKAAKKEKGAKKPRREACCMAAGKSAVKREKIAEIEENGLKNENEKMMRPAVLTERIPEGQVMEHKSDAERWREWMRDTAERLGAREEDFTAFARKWIERARLNGKLQRYQMHSIRDFIIQDFSREMTTKAAERAMREAAGCSMVMNGGYVADGQRAQQREITPSGQAYQAQGGLNIPKGVTLQTKWGSMKEKRLELMGIADSYAWAIKKTLSGENRLGELQELHTIFALNIPGYAERYGRTGGDSGAASAKAYICAMVQAGYQPINIMQQAGFVL